MADNTVHFDSRRIPLRSEPAQEEGSCSCSENLRSDASAPQHQYQPSTAPSPSCTSLQPIPSPATASSDNSPPSSASTELAHERQTLLLMLLGQVCSLHDATPRTFVVHVIALYERGILDSNSIKFLFDLGLVPRGYDLSQIGGGGGSGGEMNGGEGGHNDDTTTANVYQENETHDVGKTDGDSQQRAIVPYCAEAKQHPWTQYIPPSSIHSSQRNSNKNKEDEYSNNLHSKKMAHRQKEATAIRKHLERHESIDSSVHGSIFGSTNTAMQGIAAASTTSSSTSALNNFDKKWDRAYSSATQHNSLTSADESFDNPSFRPSNMNLHNNDMPSASSSNQQLATQMPPTASWSVEHHPLSLSRYQREFHQLSLLATGSFGSVYHAIHKLEQRPYAVKCVTFSTMGYYANTLALVIREVRCLAQLDHPNCVRYYTSWLEPSWMTGDQKEAFESDDNEHDDDNNDYLTSHSNGGNGSPKLLTDIERVIEGLNRTEEIDTSVEKLEAILFGNDGDEADDGFNWASSSPQKNDSSAFTFDRTEQKEAVDDWDNLPSHQSGKYHSMMYSRSRSGDSEVSEWTQDWNNSSEGSTTSEPRESFHNSQAPNYNRQESLELVPARPGAGGHQHQQRQPYKKQNSSSSTSATYKYQISCYIQMELCKPSTLADWIKRRNGACVDFDSEERQARARPAFEVFRQIVNGLAHVHAKKIIHRDLKPANIFAGDDGSFMIGDFGLSKMMRDATNLAVDTEAIILPRRFSNNDIHTAGVGTASYASPEQTTSKLYGTAADIFSLGLILLELFSNFTSEHERAKAFHDCRHGRELAPWMKRYYPEVSALILACTQADWSRRPTASDIQAAGVFQESGNGAEIFRAELRALKVEMTRKDRLIQHQKEQISEKDDMIESLKQRLAEVEASIHMNAEGDDAANGLVEVEESVSCSSSDGDY